MTRIQIRRGTAAAWTAANPTLTAGEYGYETDTGKVKLGNGSTAWTSLAYLVAVTSVAGRTGTVTLTSSDVGLGNVDNTSDANKPVSTATQTALDGKAASSHNHAQSDVTGLTTALSGKEPSITAGTTGDYFRGDKTFQTLNKSAVGLGNVHNTSDANKPVSTATQTALDGKAASSHTHAQSDVTGLTTDLAGKEPTITAGTTGQYYRGDKTFQTLDKSAVGLGNVDNTSDANKPISTATQTALDGKAASSHSHAQSDVTGLSTALSGKQDTSAKGQANGYASLDASGLVPSTQLPSYVDDVIESASLAALPATGETGKIYVALDSGKIYRWSGSAYVEISPSPGSTDSVTEGSTNLYFTNARADTRADGRITAATGVSIQAYSANLAGFAGKSAPSGAVVGTSDTQALTNKDLTGAGNQFPSSLITSGGALGTPSSGTLTNCTSLPVSGITSSTTATLGVGALELGHATDCSVTRAGPGQLAVEGTTVLLSGGALGTPSSGTLTNCSSLPVSGITSSTTAALGVGSVELGHATDTTLTRSAAGKLAVEGVEVLLSGGDASLGTVTPATNNASSVGYTGMPANSQSAAYTLVASDAGKHIIHPSSDNNARTFTIPANSSVAYPVGTVITFVNAVNTLTIAITTDTMTLAGTTTTGSRTLAANGLATAIKIGSTNWLIAGPGLT